MQEQELTDKRQKLKELAEKELTKSLPLAVQITNLEREIKELENKPTRTPAEEALLTEKKKQLEELLKKQSSTTSAKPKDRTALYICLGAGGLLTLLLIIILTRVRKQRKKY